MYKTRFNDSGEELKLPALINGEFVDVTYRPKKLTSPMSECLDIYHVFPDPFSGNTPRFVTERNVVSIQKFMEMFGGMINSEDNEIKLKPDEVADIIVNKNDASFEDYGNIRERIFQDHNNYFSKSCSLYKSSRANPLSSTSESTDAKANRCEFKLTTYEDRIILIANGYPVFS